MAKQLVEVIDRKGHVVHSYTVELLEDDCHDAEYEEVALILAEKHGAGKPGASGLTFFFPAPELLVGVGTADSPISYTGYASRFAFTCNAAHGLDSLQDPSNSFSQFGVARSLRRQDMNVACSVDVNQRSVRAAQDYFHGVAVFLGDAQKNRRSIDDFQVRRHRDAPY